MAQYVDPNLVKTQQMGFPLDIRVVFTLNTHAQKLRFPSSKYAQSSFVTPKTLLGSVPKGYVAKNITVNDFVKEISYESAAHYNQEWPKSPIGAEPIQLTLTMDNRFGRFNYIVPGTVVQLKRLQGTKYNTFLKTYVWNIEKTAGADSHEITITCVDRLYWLNITDVNVNYNSETGKLLGFNQNNSETSEPDNTTTAPATEGTTTTTTTDEKNTQLGSQTILKGLKTEKIIIRLAKRYKIPIGVIPKTATKLTCKTDFPKQDQQILPFIFKLLELTKNKKGQTVSFDVHARDGKLNVIPLKTPKEKTRVLRFTDETMIRSGIKLTESHDPDKFATQFLLTHKVQVETVTGTAPTTGTGGTGTGSSGGQQTGPSVPVPGNGAKWQKNGVNYNATPLSFPNIPSWYAKPSLVQTRGVKDAKDSRLYTGRTVKSGNFSGFRYKTTFSKLPGLVFLSMLVTHIGTNNAFPDPLTHQKWDGAFDLTRYLNVSNKDRSSSPDKDEPSEAAVANTRARQVTGPSVPSAQFKPRRKRVVKIRNNKVVSGSTTIGEFRYKANNASVIKDIKMPNDVRLQQDKYHTSNNVWDLFYTKGNDDDNVRFWYEGTWEWVQTTSSNAEPAVKFITGTFNIWDYQKVPSGTGAGTGGTSPTGSPGTITSTSSTTDTTTFVVVNPKNKEIQKAYGIVTKMFNLADYTGCSEDNNTTLKIRKREAQWRIENAWRPQHTLSFTTSGVLGLWANSYIYVYSKTTGVRGLFLIDSIKYTISKRQIIMAVTVNVTKRSALDDVNEFSAHYDDHLRY